MVFYYDITLILLSLFILTRQQLLFSQHTSEKLDFFKNDIKKNIYNCTEDSTCNCTFPKYLDTCTLDMKNIKLPLYYCNEISNKISYDEIGYLSCNIDKKIFEKHVCPRGSFFIKDKGCIDPTRDIFKYGTSSTGSGKVGDNCQFNTDCLSGMYCLSGVCTCLSTYILKESYCYES